MKRFITSIFLVSLVFVGIGSVVYSAKAGFEKDEKALQLIRAAKTAMGGESNLAEVRSMTIKAMETLYFEAEGQNESVQGGLEINFELPGRYSKNIKMGGEGNRFGSGAGKSIVVELDEDIDGANISKREGNKGVFVFKKSKDGVQEVTADTDGTVTVVDDKVIIKKEDGTVEEIKIDKNKQQKVVVKKVEGGETIDIVGPEKSNGTWTDENGNVIKVKKHKTRGHSRHGNEMARMTMALIMNAPTDGSVTYKYLGVENVDGYASNVIDVAPTRGEAFKLFLDVSTNLPRAIAYNSREMNFFFAAQQMTREEVRAMKKAMEKGAPRIMKFDDFRSVDGINIPHRWTIMDGDQIEKTIDVTNIDINPENISEKFGKRRFVVKEMKK